MKQHRLLGTVMILLGVINLGNLGLGLYFAWPLVSIGGPHYAQWWLVEVTLLFGAVSGWLIIGGILFRTVRPVAPTG
jgi:hypothetical protein